jgi:glycosyltransferase involved in cell wall biosynthesis
VPTFNSTDTIRDVIRSIERQTFRDFEIIVVDDASTDGTVDLLKREFPWHRVISLPRNLGPAGARNAGIRAARGEWIAFLDGDDVWMPWRLADQFEAVRLFPDAVLICGDIELTPNAAGLSEGSAAESPWSGAGRPREALRVVQLEDFIDENPAPTSTVLARRRAIQQAGGFDEQFRGPEDIDLWMRIAAAGPVVKLKTPLARYQERPGSLSMDQDRFLPQIVRVYEKAFAQGGALHAYCGLRRRAIAGRYVSAAWSYRECGRRGRAFALVLQSWVIWPVRLKIEQKRPLWRIKMLGKIVLNKS